MIRRLQSKQVAGFETIPVPKQRLVLPEPYIGIPTKERDHSESTKETQIDLLPMELMYYLLKKSQEAESILRIEADRSICLSLNKQRVNNRRSVDVIDEAFLKDEHYQQFWFVCNESFVELKHLFNFDRLLNDSPKRSEVADYNRLSIPLRVLRTPRKYVSEAPLEINAFTFDF